MNIAVRVVVYYKWENGVGAVPDAIGPFFVLSTSFVTDSRY